MTQPNLANDGYTFHLNNDSFGDDIKFVAGSSITELMQICNSLPMSEGFNTLGYIKGKIKDIDKFININFVKGNGLYVKNKYFRIKMICNWCNSEQLCNEWNNMSKCGDYTWNNIKITWEDNDIDFYVIINKAIFGEYFVPERTILFHMEPWCGVHSWGQWADPDLSKFLQIRSHKNYHNNGSWQFGLTYSQLKTMKIHKTKILSSICSSKYYDPGHIKRIDFLKYIESKKDDTVTIDIYGRDNNHNFANYKGSPPMSKKEVGILPYKYYFMAENNTEYNYMTEKIWEPLITETLVFYWGCPNLSEYIDPRSYIELDLNDFPKSFQIMKNAILNDEWGKRLEIIRREKQKVLEYYGFFPTVDRIINQDFKFNYKPTDEEITYHKYFNELLDINVKKICFIHSCTINNNTTILTTLTDTINVNLLNDIDYLYIINIGDPHKLDHHCKIRLINYSRDTQLFERATLNLICTFSKFHKNAKILYLHSYFELQKNMLYFLVENGKQCIELLDKYDTVGCNYIELPNKHYSGNFWWANSSYINKLNKITSNDRHDCKWWILSGDAVNHI
ncbi:MAG: glycosyltransferase [Harvfovirus sp.]|uniref:Glycosyltransferase n=1 Tax=Harvfovirus sp. TaxID=2487768 RepID=A0A3G5A0C8_9VIRU|nr:MAG: glycosyltransferase [Harvfovirus sp.]